MSAFDRPPSGFRRSTSSQGWIKPLPNPQAKLVKNLKAELEELRDLMESQIKKSTRKKSAV